MTIIIGFASMEFLSAEHFYGTFLGPQRCVCVATFMDAGRAGCFHIERKIALITLLASSRNEIKIIVCGSAAMLVPFIILYLIITAGVGAWNANGWMLNTDCVYEQGKDAVGGL